MPIRLYEPHPPNAVPDSPYDTVIVPKPRGAVYANSLMFASSAALYVVVLDVASIFGTARTTGMMMFGGAALLLGGVQWLRNRVSLTTAIVICGLCFSAAIYDVNNIGRLASWHWARTEHPKGP